MRTLPILATACAALLVAACGAEELAERLAESAQPLPVPADKAAYVGVWEAPGMQLSIRAEGIVRYERTRGSGARRLEGPLRGFSGDDFEVGIGSLTTTFEVSEPPHEDGGVWRMTVDGVELERTAELPVRPDDGEGLRV